MLRHVLLLRCHPDHEFPLVSPRCQGFKGELHLVQGVNPLPDLRLTVITLLTTHLTTYRIQLSLCRQLAKVVQHISVKSGCSPILGMMQFINIDTTSVFCTCSTPIKLYLKMFHRLTKIPDTIPDSRPYLHECMLSSHVCCPLCKCYAGKLFIYSLNPGG